ncbi:MAG: hypothetical protein R6U88_05815 [Candidatus Bipolaricaulota bacterium]
MMRISLVAVAIALTVAASGSALQITQLEFEFTLMPGEEREFSFQVRNDGESAQRITTQLGDWKRAPTGGHHFLEPGALPRSLADWLEVSPHSFTLGPSEVQEVSGTVRVPPANPDLLGGTHWAVIFVQGEPRLQEHEGAMVLSVERFGVKVLVDLPPRERDATIQALEPGGLNPLWVEIEVANTGNTNLSGIEGNVIVYDQTGEELGRYAIDSFSCLPGAKRIVHVETDLQLSEAGDYNILVTVDAGLDHLIATQRIVRVRRLALQPLEEGWDVPQDLSGDGLYEDVLGDGSFHQGDVDALGEYLYRPAVQRNWRAFDFANDGQVSADDVAALQAMLDAQED